MNALFLNPIVITNVKSGNFLVGFDFRTRIWFFNIAKKNVVAEALSLIKEIGKDLPTYWRTKLCIGKYDYLSRYEKEQLWHNVLANLINTFL